MTLNPFNKKLESLLLNDLKAKKNNDNYQLTISDRIVEMFVLHMKGIYKNGKTVEQIGDALGYNMNSFKEKVKFRTMLCNTIREYLQLGFPFGSVKISKQKKKYGIAINQQEINQVIYEKKLRLRSEIERGVKLFSEKEELFIRNSLRQVYIDVSNQLSLPFDNIENEII